MLNSVLSKTFFSLRQKGRRNMHEGLKDGSIYTRMLLTERDCTLKTKIIRQKKEKNVTKK